MQDEDGELVRQALAGRAAAYGQLVRRWSARVNAVCHARVGRADAAEDLAQETLLRGWRGLPSLAEPARFGPWLCGIASRTCLDWLKAAERSVIPFSALATGKDGNGGAAIEVEDQRAANPAETHDEVGRLMREVERLPPEYREVLMHYYYHDYTYQGLADLLGVSAATVNARLTKARALLRQRLGAGAGHAAAAAPEGQHYHGTRGV